MFPPPLLTLFFLCTAPRAHALMSDSVIIILLSLSKTILAPLSLSLSLSFSLSVSVSVSLSVSVSSVSGAASIYFETQSVLTRIFLDSAYRT